MNSELPSVIRRWSMIVPVIVVMNMTVVDSDRHFDNLSGSHIQSHCRQLCLWG